MPSAMVEFDSIEGNNVWLILIVTLLIIKFGLSQGASRAREYLNGFDMYSGGCNKLQIEFAWTTKLFVVVNDLRRSWDFTVPQIQMNCSYDSGYQMSQMEPVYQNSSACQYYNINMTQSQPQLQQQRPYQVQKTQNPLIVFASAPMFQPNVMYITGLNYETSNADKLFNLFSLYGNVAKIQFMPCRQGTAMVQMFDYLSAENCIRYLNNVPLGNNSKLQVFWSHPSYAPTNMHPFKLLDGSGSYKDFTESKNQRFLVPRPSFWIQSPSKILRYYNIPSSLTEENLMGIFYIKPMQIRTLKMPADEDSKMSRGLIEFATVAQAILAIMKYNNKEIRSKTKNIHYMKLCFSSSQTLDTKI